MVVPATFADRIRGTFGSAGESWLERLPVLLDELARQWDLSLGAPFELSYNYVARVHRRDGAAGVLKVGVPVAENRREIAALRVYDGRGACRVVESDAERCAMLLERIFPGEMLVGLVPTDDERATRIGAGLLLQLWRPVPAESADQFDPLVEWFAVFDRHRLAYGGAGQLPAHLFERAVSTARALLDSAPAAVLLHGDFHHYNVLSSANDEWLAIDPKGMIGDRGYDAGPFVCNPRPEDGPRSPELLRRRLDILSDVLDYDRARLHDWCVAHAMLSACWSAEDDGDGWQAAITTAEMLLAAL